MIAAIRQGRARRAAPALLAVLAATACGAPSADLFVVHRSGSGRNAKLTLLVQDDGSVVCNGGKPRPITSRQLLDARQLARDLGAQAELNLALPARPGAVLRYRVRLEAGSVSFADTSRPLPRSFSELQLFTTTIGEQVCGLSRQ